MTLWSFYNTKFVPHLVGLKTHSLAQFGLCWCGLVVCVVIRYLMWGFFVCQTLTVAQFLSTTLSRSRVTRQTLLG